MATLDDSVSEVISIVEIRERMKSGELSGYPFLDWARANFGRDYIEKLAEANEIKDLLRSYQGELVLIAESWEIESAPTKTSINNRAVYLGVLSSPGFSVLRKDDPSNTNKDKSVDRYFSTAINFEGEVCYFRCEYVENELVEYIKTLELVPHNYVFPSSFYDDALSFYYEHRGLDPEMEEEVSIRTSIGVHGIEHNIDINQMGSYDANNDLKFVNVVLGNKNVFAVLEKMFEDISFGENPIPGSVYKTLTDAMKQVNKKTA